jgi:hypothetical protein
MALTEFGKMKMKVEHLGEQLAIANTHFHIYQKLRDAQIGEFQNEFYKSKDFWGYTTAAHIQIAVLHLCRIYDVHKAAFHLTRFLEEIPQTRFSQSDKDQWQAALVSLEQQASIKKLKKWRDSLIAHSNAKFSLDGLEQFLKDHPVDLKEIQELIDNGFSILERWAYHCEDEVIQKRIDQGTLPRRSFKKLAEGADDYRFVLELMRLGRSVKTVASL